MISIKAAPIKQPKKIKEVYQIVRQTAWVSQNA
jgi:hypothetical protein